MINTHPLGLLLRWGLRGMLEEVFIHASLYLDVLASGPSWVASFTISS